MSDRHEDRQRSPRLVPTSPYAAQLALVAIAAVLIVMSLLMLRGGDGRAARGLKPGATMPPFAAPLARSQLDGDVNLARADGSGRAGAVAACSIARRDVITSCMLTARGPLVLMFATPAARCVAALERLGQLERSLRRAGVNVAAVAVRGDRRAWRRAAARWSFPLLYDRDGALAVTYAAPVCPQVTVAARGGRIRTTIIGELEPDGLERRVRAALGLLG